MSNLTQTLDLILSQLSNYGFKQRVKQDVVNLISQVPSLTPQIGTLCKSFEFLTVRP